MRGAAGDDGEGGEARGVEGGAGGGDDLFALLGGEVHVFAVGALAGDGGHACFGEADGVLGRGGEVDVFVGGEEGDHGNVDAGDERALRGGAVPVCAVGGGHVAMGS